MNQGAASQPRPPDKEQQHGVLYREDGGDMAAAAVAVVRRGGLLKRCRLNGDQKPWKRRWFFLQGGSLLYHRSADGSGHPRLLCDVRAASTVKPMAMRASPQGFGILIVTDGVAAHVDADSEDARRGWLAALDQARDLPLVRAREPAARPPSTMVLFKMNLAGAVATSRVGRKVIKHYLDDSAKMLIACLLELAETLAGPKVARAFETGIFDVCARIAVIMHEDKLPPGTNVRRLYDETVAFCQDFQMNARDRLFAEQRGPDAEVSRIDMPELLRSSSVIVSVWRGILEPNTGARTLRRFDEVCAFFFAEERLALVLSDPAHRGRLKVVYTSLKDLMERY